MKHCIIVKWKEDAPKQEDMLPAIEELFRRTLSIPGVEDVKLIPNVIARPNRYDLMIAITMQPEALPVYDACEPHHQWKDQYGSLIASKAIFDCEEFERIQEPGIGSQESVPSKTKQVQMVIP